MSDPSESATSIYLVVLLALALLILVGAGFLAMRNIRDGRGDRRGAIRLGLYMTAVLLALWICNVHLVADVLVIVTFLVAVCTAVFYGVLIWTLYLALEPLVRRHWPQVLVSWTNVLTGRAADPVVGRDVLIGVALGVWFSVLFRALALVFTGESCARRSSATSVRPTCSWGCGAPGRRAWRGAVCDSQCAAVLFRAVCDACHIPRRGWLAGVAFTPSRWLHSTP